MQLARAAFCVSFCHGLGRGTSSLPTTQGPSIVTWMCFSVGSVDIFVPPCRSSPLLWLCCMSTDGLGQTQDSYNSYQCTGYTITGCLYVAGRAAVARVARIEDARLAVYRVGVYRITILGITLPYRVSAYSIGVSLPRIHASKYSIPIRSFNNNKPSRTQRHRALLKYKKRSFLPIKNARESCSRDQGVLSCRPCSAPRGARATELVPRSSCHGASIPQHGIRDSATKADGARRSRRRRNPANLRLERMHRTGVACTCSIWHGRRAPHAAGAGPAVRRSHVGSMRLHAACGTD